VFGDRTLPNPAGELRALPQKTHLDLREALCDTEERAMNRDKKRGRDPKHFLDPPLKQCFRRIYTII